MFFIKMQNIKEHNAIIIGIFIFTEVMRTSLNKGIKGKMERQENTEIL